MPPRPDTSAAAWLAILGERHALHDGCRILFQPTFHAVAAVVVERIAGLAVVRARTIPRAAADLFFWSGGRLLSPGPDDVRPLPHARFEALLPDDCEFFAFAAALDPSGADEDACVRDGMPTTTTLYRDGLPVLTRAENPPRRAHRELCERALAVAAAHLPGARACLAAVRSYLD